MEGHLRHIMGLEDLGLGYWSRNKRERHQTWEKIVFELDSSRLPFSMGFGRPLGDVG